MKSTLRQSAAYSDVMYLIRTLLPLILSAMSVIASLLERDMVLDRIKGGLSRIAAEVGSLGSDSGIFGNG